ncbi:MAG: nucleotide exchange factor GrpE [Aquificota bacterium]|nr:nucleotide exchange factor GrpE [Aquificota bacterium]
MEEKKDIKEERVKEEAKGEEENTEALRERIRELEEKVKKLETVARSSNIRVMDLQRELEYLRERYRKDLEEQRRFGHEKLALDILRVLDNFERALSAAKKSGDFESLLKGIELIHSDLVSILEKHGIREMEIEGKEFDPHLAEAVETVRSEEHPPNRVIRVVQKGYYIHERVLRPAKVVVSLPEEEIA